MSTQSSKSDEVRRRIVEQIVTAIEQGTVPWRRPWNAGALGLPANFKSGRRYSGINVLVLQLAAIHAGYTSRSWGPADAWLKYVGGHVRQGETPTDVIFFTMVPKKDERNKLVLVKGKPVYFPLLRYTASFNAEQIQAPSVESLKALKLPELREIAERYLPKAVVKTLGRTRASVAEAIHHGIDAKLRSYSTPVVKTTHPDFEPAERLIRSTGADVRHGGDRAFYRPADDFVQLPPKASFDTMVDYYGTAFHELGHWSLVPERAGRTHKFEDKEKYAFEELVAELSACFVQTEIGVPLAETMLPKSQAYLASWLSVMKNDPKYLFLASTHASKVTDYLLACERKQKPEPDLERAVA